MVVRPHDGLAYEPPILLTTLTKCFKRMTIEEHRYELQCELDASKSQQERNEMGQFATPYKLACEIANYALTFFPKRKNIRVLEPACGTGVFFSALEHALGERHIKGSLGFEIDPVYQQPAANLWNWHGIDIRCADFLQQSPDNHYQLLISNPPYTRHHHIPPKEKTRLQLAVKEQTGLAISGLAGLYCYFMLLSSSWLEKGGLSCWLVPSEFMDVNYGEAVRQFLLNKVDLVRIHRFDENDLQFKDALVTSAVVFFKTQPPSETPIDFSFSGSIAEPARRNMVDRQSLAKAKKWNCFFKEKGTQSHEYAEVLGDFFEVKRGIATGCNDFFVIDPNVISKYGIPEKYLTPILPSPRKLKTGRIMSDGGKPILTAPLFLFSSDDSLITIRREYPGVAEYIEKGAKEKIDQSYICSRHTPWYSCEKRKPAPFVIPYMGRNGGQQQMFRFILNESDAVTTNGYLMMYPKKEYAYLFNDKQLVYKIWEQLNNIPMESFERQGRFYGGGLHKIEPRELLRLPAENISKLLGNHIQWVA